MASLQTLANVQDHHRPNHPPQHANITLTHKCTPTTIQGGWSERSWLRTPRQTLFLSKLGVPSWARHLTNTSKIHP